MSRVAESKDATHSATYVVRARSLSFAAGLASEVVAVAIIGWDRGIHLVGIETSFVWRARSRALPVLV
jgi:hypothetical protein